MSIRLKSGPDGCTIFDIHCDACGEVIDKAGLGGVLFQYPEPGEPSGPYWFYHKATGCLQEIEARELREGQHRLPWWELSWFLKELLKSMKDLDVSGATIDALTDGYTVKRNRKVS